MVELAEETGAALGVNEPVPKLIEVFGVQVNVCVNRDMVTDVVNGQEPMV